MKVCKWCECEVEEHYLDDEGSCIFCNEEFEREEQGMAQEQNMYGYR